MCLLATFLQAQNKAKISAVVDGYNGKVVDFEFIDDTERNMQFPYVENRKMEFEVELTEPSLLKINAYVWLIVCPGDEISATIHYNGRNYKTAEFTGTEKAVLLSETIRDARNSRIAIHYKMNPLAAVVTQVSVEKYYQTTLEQWKKESAMLEAIKDRIDPMAYNYIYSELEGTFMSNLVNYPYMFAEINKKPLELPKDFWNVLDGYTFREDKGSLKSYTYISWFLAYKDYVDKKAAEQAGKAYQPETDLTKGYENIANFYEGDIRDAALYVYFYNAITRQMDFDMIKKLTKEYFKKYNRNKLYKTTLQAMQK